MSYQVQLDALGTTYDIPEAGETNYANDLSLYLRDLATVVNDGSSGSLVTPVFNVKTYGATGNGTTNDTGAILLAMAALLAASATGGTLYFPAGTYVTSATLQFGVAAAQSGVRIVGDGPNSVIKPTGAFSTTPVIEFRDCNYWVVSDIKIDASARTGSGDNILVDGCSYGYCTNSSIFNATRYGVNVTRVSGASVSTFNWVSGNVFSGNSTANTNVTRSSTAVGTVANNLSGILPGPYYVDVKTQFGVTADGTTDDTAAIQAALDYGYSQVETAHAPCMLLFPPGTMKITSTLLWRGNSATAPALIGAVPSGGSFNFSGSTFAWYGASDGVLFFAQSANKGVMQDLCFDGRSLAGILTHLSASTYADPTILAATSGIRVLRCGFRHCKVNTVGNGCVALGTDPALVGGATYQQSEVVFRDCRFVGEDSGAPGFSYANMKAYGIKTLAAGNCKNFAAEDCEFNRCNVPIDWSEASGNFNVTNFQVGDCRYGVISSGGHLSIIGGDVECGHVDDFRLLYGTGGGGEATAYLEGLDVVPFMSGAVGTMISWGGSLTLIDNYFVNGNYSVSGVETLRNPFKFVINVVDNALGGGSLVSSGNFYACTPAPYIPVVDGSANSLAPVSGTYGGEIALRISSFGDKYNTNVTATPTSLTSFDSSDKTSFSVRMNGPIQYSYLSSGNPADSSVANKTICPIDSSSGNQTFTLTPAATTNLGRVITVTKHTSDSNTVTCNGVVLRSQYEAASFVSTGAAWDLLGIYLTAGAQRVNGAKTFSSPLIYSATTGITAFAGGGQASATALTTEVNYVTTVASANDSVKLPTAVLGLKITIFNQGANAANVYPVTGGAIDALGANNPFPLAAGTSKDFYGQSGTQWYSK